MLTTSKTDMLERPKGYLLHNEHQTVVGWFWWHAPVWVLHMPGIYWQDGEPTLEPAFVNRRFKTKKELLKKAEEAYEKIR